MLNLPSIDTRHFCSHLKHSLVSSKISTLSLRNSLLGPVIVEKLSSTVVAAALSLEYILHFTYIIVNVKAQGQGANVGDLIICVEWHRWMTTFGFV